MSGRIPSVLSGELAVEELTYADYRRTLEVLRRYESARIGFVDATVMAVAERLKIPRILTTDRRDFSILRPRHCKHWNCCPDQPTISRQSVDGLIVELTTAKAAERKNT